MSVDIALNLIKNIPEAQRVFDELNDKKDFSVWFTNEPDMLRGDITTAIHESVHMIRANTGKYILIEGGWVDAPEKDDILVVAPSKIVHPALKNSYSGDSFLETYMTEGEEASSSADYFSYLLDEFNAYCHDLNVFAKLETLPINSTPRDGLVAFMLFTLVYLDGAKPLLSDAQKKALVSIWEQAERVLDETSHIKHISYHADKYLNDMAPLLHVMSPYLGRSARDFRSVGHISEKAASEIDVETTERNVPVYRRLKNWLGIGDD